MATRIAWKFTDDVLTTEWFLPVNPTADAGSHAITKTVRYSVTASNYLDNSNTLRIGDTVAQDASSEVERFSYTGTVYKKDQLANFRLWCNKDYPWTLRDDLGRVFLIYVENFSTERVRSVKFPWKHTYSFSGVVLEEIEE